MTAPKANIIMRMAKLFWLPTMLLIISIVYSRMNSDISYSPEQVVAFSHKVHSGDYQIKCLFCHTQAESKSFSPIPTTRTCMVCHVALRSESEAIKPLADSYDTGRPLHWIRIYKLPEYAKFNHDIHLAANIDCSSCHGNVEKMEKTKHKRDFTMSWCIDCHRKPIENIIPSREISGIFVQPSNQFQSLVQAQFHPKTKPAYGAYINEQVFNKYGIKSAKQPDRGPENCSACHY